MEKKTGILNTFIRYGKLLFVFLKMSLMTQLEYRINFAAGVLVETGWLLIKLLYVAVVYRAGIKIGVLTPDHILLFIGVYILLTGVYMLYYPNFTSLTTMIRDGKLDMSQNHYLHFIQRCKMKCIKQIIRRRKNLPGLIFCHHRFI